MDTGAVAGSKQREAGVSDYRTLAIVDALTSLGVTLDDWQVEALDRMMLASAAEDDDG